jgi:pimeloyl-ACP methyl ester carboxylesterase
MGDFKSFEGLWAFEVFGNGDEILLAFHGLNNHYTDFRILEPALGKKFKVISFNLPYHGNKTDNLQGRELSYSNNDLKELFEKFLALNSIKDFSVMGYSLGGKIVLEMIELFPDRINNVLLFAPDGIENKWEYGFVTKTALGKNLYKRIINNPTRFLRIVKLLKSTKIINPKLYEFVHYQLSTRDKRQLVWDVWRCFRDVKPNVRKIQNIINEKQINIHLFFGKYDSVIPPAIGKKFILGLNNKGGLHVIEAGHNLIRDKTNADLKSLF